MKTRLLYLLLFLSVWVGYTQETVEILDTNFEQALIDLGFDTNGLNGNILATDAQKIDSLKIWNPTNIVNPDIPLNPNLTNVSSQITDISAIKFMPNLTYLYAGYNNISTIDVSQNTLLTYLDLRVNQLTEIDVSNNQLLLFLNVAFNKLTNLDVTNNYNLIGLAIYSNSIRDVDVRRNYQLLQLAVGLNPMPYINVLNNSKLTDLDISYTLIEDVDLSKNPLLKRLRLIQTNLDEIDLESNTLLTRIDFLNNDNISELNLFKQQNLDTLYVSSNPNLVALNLKNGANTKISDFKSLLNPKLTCINVDDVDYSTTNWITKDATTIFGVNCYNNSAPAASNLSFRLESIDLWDILYASYTYSDNEDDQQKGTILKWFIADDNQGTNKIELTSNRNETRLALNFSHNGKFISFEVTPSDGINIGEKTESSYYGPINTSLRSQIPSVFPVPDANFEQALVDLGYDDKIDGFVLMENVKNITSLNLEGKNISNLSGISSFKNLETLDSSNNNLVILDLTSNTNLRFLTADNNSIEELDLPYSSRLQTLYISNNKLKALDLSKFNDLKNFIATDGSFQALKINNENNVNLTSFDIRNNPSLQCVQVDDVSYSTNNWTNIDDNSLFSEMCSSSPPTVSNLEITGELVQYEELTASYEYFDVDGYSESESKIEWYISDDEFGRNITEVYRKRNSFKATFTHFDIGKYISFKITPGNGFTSGATVESAMYGPIQPNTTVNNKPPTATNLQLYGQLYAGKVISALYDYADIDEDTETESLYYWYLADDEVGTNKEIIEEANAKEYVLTTEHVGKFLSFEVIPNDGKDFGRSVTSNFRGPISGRNNPPTATNLVISGELKIGDILTATYDYTDLENEDESGSIFQWYISDDGVGTNKTEISEATDITYTLLESQEGKFISFKVTPYDGIDLGETKESNLRGPINGDEVIQIPDTVFEQKLIDAGFDTNGLNGNILKSEAEAITQLNFSNNFGADEPIRIKDATGIEQMPNLTNISFDNHSLTSINVNNNPKLETLRLFYNDISQLDVSNNNMLTILDAAHNNLTQLNTTNLTELTTLFLNNNNTISGLDLIANTKLTTAWLSYNDLSVIDLSSNNLLVTLRLSGNNLDEVNLSNLQDLDRFDIQQNNLTSLNVSNSPNLRFLDFKNNEISNIDVSNNVKLLDFQASNNKLTEIDITKNLALTSFQASNNLLTGVNLIKNTELLKLYLNNNKIINIDINQNKMLTELYLNDNSIERAYLKNGNNSSITNFNISNNPNLTCITVDDIDFSNANWTNKDTTANYNIDCNGEWEVYTKDENINAVLNNTPGVDNDGDGMITYEEAQAFTGDLDLSGQNITDITGLEAFVNATSINISGNSITDISSLLTANTVIVSSGFTGEKRTVARNQNQLKILNVANNLIEEIDISEVSTITELNVSNNKLTYLNINNGNNFSISTLDATGNPDLGCIQVDNVTNANEQTNWFKDATASYSENCQETLNNEEFLKENITLSPNPTTTSFLINVSNNLIFKKVNLYNLTGQKLVSSNEKNLDISNLSQGIYFAKISTDLGTISVKIIKR